MKFIEVSEATTDVKKLFAEGKLYVHLKGFTPAAKAWLFDVEEAFSHVPKEPTKVTRIDVGEWALGDGYYADCFGDAVSLVERGGLHLLQLTTPVDA